MSKSNQIFILLHGENEVWPISSRLCSSLHYWVSICSHDLVKTFYQISNTFFFLSKYCERFKWDYSSSPCPSIFFFNFFFLMDVVWTCLHAGQLHMHMWRPETDSEYLPWSPSFLFIRQCLWPNQELAEWAIPAPHPILGIPCFCCMFGDLNSVFMLVWIKMLWVIFPALLK